MDCEQRETSPTHRRGGVLSAARIVLINAIYIPYLALFSLFYPLFALVFVAAYLAAGLGRFDDAVRVQNVLFGRFLLFLSRPLVRVDVSGIENFPRRTPCVLVLNHRCFADIILCTRLPIWNANVVIRSWPFRIPLFGFFMRRAGYFDIESRPFEELADVVERQKTRGASFVFFPEGHRSRDGRLQTFRSGAFLISDRCGLPLVPVCLTGSEKMIPFGSVLVRPARVEMKVFEPICPSRFSPERRALRMRREAAPLFRRHLGEERAPSPKSDGKGASWDARGEKPTQDA